MAYENEQLIALYFHCEDLKKKKAIANLFRHSLEYGVPQTHDVITSHYNKFCVKLEKLDGGNMVSLDFFKHVLFGMGDGPVATCPNKGAASLELLLGGNFGEHPKSLLEFVCSFGTELESVVESNDMDSNRYLWLKKLKGRELESRQFEHESDRIDPGLFSRIENAYDWLQDGLSFTAPILLYTVEHFRGLAAREEKPPPEFSDITKIEIVNLLKAYGFLSEFDEVIFDNHEDQISLVISVLEEKAANRIISYPSVQGGWMEDQLVEEYASLIVEFCKKANITIKDLTLSPPLDEFGKEDPELDMSISFTHKGKRKKWTFSMETEDEYFSKFNRWARSAVGGGYLWFSADIYTGYLLPKELIAELEKFGGPGEK